VGKVQQHDDQARWLMSESDWQGIKAERRIAGEPSFIENAMGYPIGWTSSNE